MKVTLAATQFACTGDRAANLANAERTIREAARQGANIILIQELFETPYFCIEHNTKYFDVALPIEENPAVRRFQQLARELNVVLPASVFERAGNAFYNSVAIIDAGGALLGTYRKTHIPESPGYHEKFYFSPGDTGFKVWRTRFGAIGVAICWDQWFPESARAMALLGAEILFYPTAIGSEPQDTQHRLARSLAARDARPRGVEHHARRRVEPHRHRARRALGSHVLRLVVHHRSCGCHRRPGAAHRRSDRHRDGRSRRDPRLSHGVGRVPRSPAGDVRAVDDVGRNSVTTCNSSLPVLRPSPT